MYCFSAQVLKICRTPGFTAYSKTKMLQLPKVWVKSYEEEKNSCLDLVNLKPAPIQFTYIQTLTGVHQAVRYFLFAIFYAFISIE